MPEPMSLLADFGTISPSFDALSDHLLQNFTGRETPKAVQLASLTVEVRLSPYEALQGVMVPLGIPVFMRCAVCGGLWARLVHAVPVLPRPRHGRDRAYGPRASSTAGAGGHDGGGTVTQLGIHNVFVRVHIRITWWEHRRRSVVFLTVMWHEMSHGTDGEALPVRLWFKNFWPHQLDVIGVLSCRTRCTRRIASLLACK